MTTAIFRYNQDIREMQTRIRSILPNGNRFTPQEAELLARAAVAYQLDPFNGEIWLLKESENRGGKLIGLQIGIKGLRRKAREQIGSGNYWTIFREITDTSERQRWQIPTGALAFECRLFDSETITTYVNSIKLMRDASMPIETILRIVGEQPYTVGIGIFRTGESSRMLPIQCAQKRAEADATKRRFDVHLDFGEIEPTDGSLIEAEPDRPKSTVDIFTGEIKPETPAAESAPVSADSPEQQPSTRHSLLQRINARVLELNDGTQASDSLVKVAAASLKTLCGGDDDLRKRVVNFLFDRESMRLMTVAECRALTEWIDIQKINGEWIPSAHSIAELESIKEYSKK